QATFTELPVAGSVAVITAFGDAVVLPYELIVPSLRCTVKLLGPVALVPPVAVTRIEGSFSGEYVVFEAPYVPELVKRSRTPSRQNRSVCVKLTGKGLPLASVAPTKSPLSRICRQRVICDAPSIVHPGPMTPFGKRLLYVSATFGVMPAVPGTTWIGIEYVALPLSSTRYCANVAPTWSAVVSLGGIAATTGVADTGVVVPCAAGTMTSAEVYSKVPVGLPSCISDC